MLCWSRANMACNPPECSKRQHHNDAEFNNSKADRLCFEWNDGVGLQKDPPDSIRRKIICRRCQKPYAWWYIKHYRPQYADSESQYLQPNLRAEIVGVEAYFRKKVARANGEASRLRLDLERVNTENDNLKQSNAEKDVKLNEMMEVVREQQQIIDEVKVKVKELKKDLQSELETTKS